MIRKAILAPGDFNQLRTSGFLPTNWDAGKYFVMEEFSGRSLIVNIETVTGETLSKMTIDKSCPGWEKALVQKPES